MTGSLQEAKRKNTTLVSRISCDLESILVNTLFQHPIRQTRLRVLCSLLGWDYIWVASEAACNCGVLKGLICLKKDEAKINLLLESQSRVIQQGKYKLKDRSLNLFII